MRLNVLKGIFVALTFLVISYSALYMLVPSSSPQFEETTTASFIQDGDTFQTSAGDWIRLADIDTPESYEYGYDEATNVLAELIYGKRVYLDIDDINTIKRKINETLSDLQDNTKYSNINISRKYQTETKEIMKILLTQSGRETIYNNCTSDCPYKNNCFFSTKLKKKHPQYLDDLYLKYSTHTEEAGNDSCSKNEC